MFIPVWIIVVVCILLVLKLIIRIKFHNFLKKKISDKLKESIESLDVTFKLKNLKIHGYINENKEFTFEKVD